MMYQDEHDIGDADLDRLVDGELSQSAYRELLATLDDAPEGWKRCALAFLEAQALRSELTRIAESHPPSRVVVERRPAVAAGIGRTVVALVLGFVVAFGLGAATQRVWSVRASVAPPLTDREDGSHPSKVPDGADTGRSVALPANSGEGDSRAPASDALEAQLGIENRLIVERVIEESPAAESGVQKYDVLLRFGDKEIQSLKDLMNAIENSNNKKSTISVMRGGKTVSPNIVPAERPVIQAFNVRTDGDQDIQLFINDWLAGENQLKGPLRFLTIGPGVLANEELGIDFAELPKNLQVTIKKEGGEPAAITVKRDDESWEVDETELGELPDDVRPYVERMLGRRSGFDPYVKGLRMKDFQFSFNTDGSAGAAAAAAGIAGSESLNNVRQMIREKAEAVAPQVADAIKRIENVQNLMGEVEALREEIAALRREIRELLEAQKDE